MPQRLLIAMALAACGAPEPAFRLEQWVRVGVDPAGEAEAVERALIDGGYRSEQRIEGERFVALGFVREGDDRRAVRVVTARGVVVALDSHETDGVRERHGAVRLVDLDVPRHDLDGDGEPEVVVARRSAAGECLAVVRIAGDGRARALPIEAEGVAPGSCASALEDVDGDGALEAIVELSWPALALGANVPAVRIALVSADGGWRAGAMPIGYEEREREARRTALSEARARLDVAEASRAGVELAALANLAGAARSAQVARYDEALAGLVLRVAERDRADRVRAYIAAGWGAGAERTRE